MENTKTKYVPELTSNLRNHYVSIPSVISKASGIRIFGKRLKSFIFTTDVAIIKNTNADAVIAVYPFTPQPAITQAILSVSDIPVLCGVGGGLTHGTRSANIALHAEFQGAIGAILNSPAPDETIRYVKESIDIPVVVTIVSELTDVQSKIDAGADILNVSGGADTAKLCGVGGGLTHGTRSANIALHAEFQGAIGAILNSPAPDETIRYVKESIDIPVVVTIVSELTDVQSKIDAGADILNVSGGADTAKIVRKEELIQLR